MKIIVFTSIKKLIIMLSNPKKNNYWYNFERQLFMKVKNQIKLIITVAVPVLLVLTFIIKVGNITSSSMEPLLSKGDKVIINRLSYVKSEPRKGDVVAFEKDGIMMIKRIVATSLDVVDSVDGTLLVNGYVMEEPYIEENMETDLRYSMDVPEGYYLVLGDNRENSVDARYWESPYITEEDIIGRVVYCFDSLFGKSINKYEIEEK